MPDKLTIEDLVILGRSSPDTMKDMRTSVCVAGYSKRHGFIRIYPTRMDSPLRIWNMVSVKVERNEQDTRNESWKIEGAKADWRNLSEKIEVVGCLEREKRFRFLQPLISGCVQDLNDNRASLGIVKPLTKSPYLSERADFDPTVQSTLFGGVTPSDKHSFRLTPRIKYRCSSCRSTSCHDQQIIEWGVYEWFRKHPGCEENVWDNLFHNEAKQEILFLVGNQARHRSSFIIVQILRIPKIEGWF